MASVLTIAGSDSSGRAGIQADLRTLTMLGVDGACAITAITAQNTTGVTAIQPLTADLVTAQIEAVAADRQLGATKVGMLATAAIVEAVAAAVEELDLPLVVLDPVLASTSGTRLLDRDGVQTLLLELLPQVLVITPNIPEAEALSGVRIGSPEDVRRAAAQLHRLGARNVIVKGGHESSSVVRRPSAVTRRPSAVTRRPSSVNRQASAVDVLFDGRRFHAFTVPRVNGPNVGGTGCSYSSALAAFLARGDELAVAAEKAQLHVAKLIASYTER